MMWEYATINLYSNHDGNGGYHGLTASLQEGEDMEEILNSWGEQGWELVNLVVETRKQEADDMFSEAYAYLAIFKRPLDNY